MILSMAGIAGEPSSNLWRMNRFANPAQAVAPSGRTCSIQAFRTVRYCSMCN